MTELIHSSKTSDNRIVWVDTAKVLAIMAVVCIHFGYYKLFFSSFAIPGFFFCTGYTLRKRPIVEGLLKDVKRIVVPYLLMGLLSVLFATYLREIIFSSMMGLDVGLYSARSILVPTVMILGWSIWWFLPCMFYGKTIVNGIVSVSDNRIILSIFLAAVLVAGYFANQHHMDNGSILCGMISNICIAVIFMGVGYILQSQDVYRLMPALRIPAAMVMVAIFILLVKSGFYIDMGVWDEPHYVLGIVTAMTGVGALVMFASIIPRNAFFTYWGPKTMMLYCIHGLEHNFLPWSNLDRALRNICPEKLVMLTLVVVRILLLLTITWLIEKCIGVYFERKKQSV